MLAVFVTHDGSHHASCKDAEKYLDELIEEDVESISQVMGVSSGGDPCIIADYITDNIDMFRQLIELYDDRKVIVVDDQDTKF